MKKIQTNNAPEAIGPYSQAISVSGFIFCSGQVGLDPQTGDLVEGVEKQTHQVLKNLQAVLEKAESSLEQVVKTTIYIQNMTDFATINTIYAGYFNVHKPARATVAVANLPKGALIEIDAIAVEIDKT